MRLKGQTWFESKCLDELRKVIQFSDSVGVAFNRKVSNKGILKTDVDNIVHFSVWPSWIVYAALITPS